MGRKSHFIAAVAAGAVALAGTAAAQPPAGTQAADRAGGLYGRLAGGVSFADDMDQSLEFNPAFNGIRPCLPPGTVCTAVVVPLPMAQTFAFDTGYTGSAAIGFDHGTGLRTELEYRFIQNDIDAVAIDGAQPLILTTGERARVHALLSNFTYGFENSTPITPYFGGGVGAAQVALKDNPYLAPEFDDIAFAWQAKAGLALRASERVRIGVEYAYLRTGKLTFGTEEFSAAPTTLEFRAHDTRFSASTVSLTLETLF